MMNGKSTQVLAECPYCTLPYKAEASKLVMRTGKKSIIHVSCVHCRHSMLLSIHKDINGIVCAGMFTDCEYQDVKRFLQAEKISVDDVIQTHKALKFDKFL